MPDYESLRNRKAKVNEGLRWVFYVEVSLVTYRGSFS